MKIQKFKSKLEKHSALLMTYLFVKSCFGSLEDFNKRFKKNPASIDKAFYNLRSSNGKLFVYGQPLFWLGCECLLNAPESGISEEAYKNSRLRQTQLRKAFNGLDIISKFTKRTYVERNKGAKQELPYASIWCMPWDNLNKVDGDLSLAYNYHVAEYKKHNIEHLEGLTLPNGEIMYFYSYRSKNEDDYTTRQYSAFALMEKNFRHELLKQCGEFYEIDINSCASQGVSALVQTETERKRLLSKIKTNKFYVYKDGKRKYHKKCVNQFLFSQFSEKPNVALRYSCEADKKYFDLYLSIHTTLSKRERMAFINQVIYIRQSFIEERKKGYALLLNLEEYVKNWQEANFIGKKDNYNLSLDILRVHDCLYVKGKKKAMEFVDYLKANGVHCKVEKI